MEFMTLVPSDDTNICDFEEKEALLWRQPTQDNQREEVETSTGQQPDDVWIVPPRFKDPEKHIGRIASITNTYMKFNNGESQIGIWGDSVDVEEAITQLNKLSHNKKTFADDRRKNEKDEWAAKKKEPGWAKPDKAPANKKQEAKLKRREERKRIEDMYKKKPDKSKEFPFNVYIVFPYTDINITLLFGEKEEVLDPVRIETKCHIWYEKPPGIAKDIIYIVGETKESVDQATMRVGHLFVKTFQSNNLPVAGWILHAMEPPAKKYQIRITDPPSSFYLPHEKLCQKQKPQRYKLIEPVNEGERTPVVGGTEKFKESNPTFDLDKLKKNHEKNIQELRKYFLKALESVHLCDEEIKMRVRFGRVYLVSDKEVDKRSMPITKINNHILSTSKFATCLATERDQLNRLFEVLSTESVNQRCGAAPYREFKICVIRKDPNNKEESLNCSFDVHFEKNLVKNNYSKSDEKYEGRIGLWSAIIDQRNVLDINMMNLDSYSWKLNIKKAKRLPTDENCPQGKFVKGLRICPRGRLVYSNIIEIKVVSVCEKTKWKFWWNQDYLVEVTKYEFWKLSNHLKKTGLEIPLSKEYKPVVSYGVTLYKKSWDEKFAINSNLKAGEAPDWHPYDMIDEEKNLLDDIRNFLKILQSNHPMQKI